MDINNGHLLVWHYHNEKNLFLKIKSYYEKTKKKKHENEELFHTYEDMIVFVKLNVFILIKSN